MKKRVCCFIGHRDVTITEELIKIVSETIQTLILDEQIDTFLFGSRGNFNALCYELVTQAREQYPHIRRIYVRAEYPVISDDYLSYLLERYEETEYPAFLASAGRAVYVERNRHMIDHSSICVIYDRGETPTRAPRAHNTATRQERVSGTGLAHVYAQKKKIKVINIYHILYDTNEQHPCVC